jgi:glycyl-tRNA synthetase alpha chain
LLDARGSISVTERASYIQRIRALARACCLKHLEKREAEGYPLLQKAWRVGLK